VLRKAFDDVRTKAAVLPGTTTDPAWAGALVTESVVAPLLSLVQQQSLPVRLNLLRAPFRAKVPIQNVAGNFAWVVQGEPKPATKFGFSSSTLDVGKVAGIVVLTDELVKLSDPTSEPAMRNALTAGIVAFADSQFLDPTVSLIAGERPASITNGLTPVAATGNLNADVAKLLSTLYANRPGVARPALVMSPANAGLLAAGGNHPDLRVDGSGTAFGVRVVTSPSAGNHVVALDADAVAYADGGLSIDVSRQAVIELDDAPVGAVATQVLTSLWECNLAGFRCERMLWWIRAGNGVKFVTVTP
jgi:hypothetical protein